MQLLTVLVAIYCSAQAGANKFRKKSQSILPGDVDTDSDTGMVYFDDTKTGGGGAPETLISSDVANTDSDKAIFYFDYKYKKPDYAVLNATSPQKNANEPKKAEKTGNSMNLKYYDWIDISASNTCTRIELDEVKRNKQTDDQITCKPQGEICVEVPPERKFKCAHSKLCAPACAITNLATYVRALSISAFCRCFPKRIKER